MYIYSPNLNETGRARRSRSRAPGDSEWYCLISCSTADSAHPWAPQSFPQILRESVELKTYIGGRDLGAEPSLARYVFYIIRIIRVTIDWREF